MEEIKEIKQLTSILERIPQILQLGFQSENGFSSDGRHLLHNMHEDNSALSKTSKNQNGGVEKVSNQTYTVEDAVEHMGLGYFQLKVFLICGLFAATDALEMLLLSVLSPVLKCEWHLSSWQVPFITTVVFLGMFLGSSTWGSLADKYGRWSICTISAFWITYFGFITSFSPTYAWILITRGLVGMGFGGAVQAFTLMAEYLPSKGRAKILIVFNFMWAAGSCFEVLLADVILPTLGWRYLVGFSALPMFLVLGTIWLMPESARYLAAAGQPDKAQAALEHVSRMNKVSLPPGTLEQPKPTARGQLSDLLNSETRRTTLILWFMWFTTAFSYYGVVLLSSEIFESPNYCKAERPIRFASRMGPVYKYPIFEDENANDCYCKPLTHEDYKDMIISTFGEFLSIPLNIITIDTLGRKATLIIDFFGAGVFFLLIQICAHRNLITFFIFGVRAFTAGIFNVIYIYTAEVYPTIMRSIGLGTCSAMARIGAMMTPFFAQLLLEFSLAASIWVYAGFCVLSAVAVYCLPVETKGRALKQLTTLDAK